MVDESVLRTTRTRQVPKLLPKPKRAPKPKAKPEPKRVGLGVVQR